MDNKVVIIGAGEIGRAIEKILQDKSGIMIELWDKDISKAPNQKPLTEIIPSADFLFLCVPTNAIRKVLNSILRFLNKKTLVISLSKGIEADTLKTAADILEELLFDKTQHALLFGPMLAEELVKGMPGIGVAAVKEQKVFTRIKTLFTGTNLLIEHSSDVRGVALTGVLKNIYAVGLGIGGALEFGGNLKGWLTQKAIKEIAEIIELLGGKKETAFGSAGLGDFVATGFSPYSSNRQAGEELVKTGKYLLKVNELRSSPRFANARASEGIVSLFPILKLLGENNIHKFSLLQALKKIILEGKNAKIIFEELLKEKKD